MDRPETPRIVAAFRYWRGQSRLQVSLRCWAAILIASSALVCSPAKAADPFGRANVGYAFPSAAYLGLYGGWHLDGEISLLAGGDAKLGAERELGDHPKRYFVNVRAEYSPQETRPFYFGLAAGAMLIREDYDYAFVSDVPEPKVRGRNWNGSYFVLRPIAGGRLLTTETMTLLLEVHGDIIPSYQGETLGPASSYALSLGLERKF